MGWKSRKVIVGMILILLAFVFTYLTNSFPAELSDFVKWVYGLYIAGNVGTKLGNGIGLKVTKES